ncbi:MAG: hypothetical protein ACE1Z1_06905 [Candidatus Acidiferrales bacterium]
MATLVGTTTHAASSAVGLLNPEPAELQNPQREAAFFYGLFLRGHTLEQLRRDIDVPGDVISRWQRLWRHEPHAWSQLEKILRHRRQVLANFNMLVSLEVALSHLRQ